MCGAGAWPALELALPLVLRDRAGPKRLGAERRCFVLRLRCGTNRALAANGRTAREDLAASLCNRATSKRLRQPAFGGEYG